MHKAKTINKVGIIVTSVFAFIIILLCGFIFLNDFKNAYDYSGDVGFIPGCFGVIFSYFLVVMGAMLISFFIKMIMEKKISIIALLLISVLLPILCYHFNFHMLKGPLHPLVEEGGIFHFIVIGDYNFDGMNDEKYHLLYDERTVSNSAGVSDDPIKSVGTTATGTGSKVGGARARAYPDEKIIQVNLPTNTVFKRIIIEIAFVEEEDCEKFRLDLNDMPFDTTGITYEQGNGKFVITINEQSCNSIQAVRSKFDMKYYYAE